MFSEFNETSIYRKYFAFTNMCKDMTDRIEINVDVNKFSSKDSESEKIVNNGEIHDLTDIFKVKVILNLSLPPYIIFGIIGNEITPLRKYLRGFDLGIQGVNVKENVVTFYLRDLREYKQNREMSGPIKFIKKLFDQIILGNDQGLFPQYNNKEIVDFTIRNAMKVEDDEED